MIEELKRLAASPDVESRRKAAFALGEEDPEEALPVLDTLLGDANWRVRKAAVEVLLPLPQSAVFPLLFQALHDAENAGKRNSALEALGKAGSSALPTIYQHLVDRDLDVKLALITLLGELPSKTSAPHLIYYLSHEDKNIVSGAITSLGRLRDTGSLPVLLDLFRRRDDWLWFHLIDALSNIGGPVASAKLMELFDHPKFEKAVLKAFGQMGDLKVIPFLLEKASLAENFPLLELMGTLGRIYHANMPDALLKRHQRELARLVRNHFPVALVSRMEELWSEAKITERRGLTIIAGFLADLTLLDEILSELENPYLQRDAFEAAVAFGSRGSDAVVSRLNRSQTQEQKMLLIRLLGVIDGPGAVTAVLNQAREEDVQLRMEAISALGELNDQRCLDELVSILRETDATFHEVSLSAIATMARKYPSYRGKMGQLGRAMVMEEEEGVRRAGYTLLAESIGQDEAPLLPGLTDPLPSVRRTAVGLLANRKGPEAFDRLLPLLGDESPKVRRAVIASMGRDILSRQPEILMTCLTDSDVWVRAEAAFYLAQSTAPEVGEALLKVLREDVLPVQLGALRGLAEVGCGSLFDSVMALAMDETVALDIRRAAFAALSNSSRPEAVSAIEQALEETKWEVRSAAIELMGSSGDRRYLPLLLRELERDPDLLVKQTIIQALTTLKAAEAVPRMLNYLTHPELKDQAYAFFTSLGKEHLRLIENEAQSVDFQTKLILIEIVKHLESL